MKLTTIRLPQATMDAIDELVGKKRRSDFIRNAINRELARLARDSKAKRP